MHRRVRGFAIATVVAACTLGCARPMPRLFWEAEGGGRTAAAHEVASDLPQVAPGVRSGRWGDTADASFQLLDAEAAERPHVHDTHDLTVVVLKGSGTLFVDDRQHSLAAGDVVHIGRGRKHHFHPHGSVTGLAIYTPRLLERDYREP